MSRMIEIQVEGEPEHSAGIKDVEKIQRSVEDIWPLPEVLNEHPVHLAGTGTLKIGMDPEDIIKQVVKTIWGDGKEFPLSVKVVFLEDNPYDEWFFEDRGDLEDRDVE